jgi:hypothetical protein
MHPMLNGLSREKRREKILSLSFTVFYLKTVSDGTFPIVFDVKIQTVHIRARCWCLLSRGKGHAHIIRNICSRLGKHLLSKGISQKPFLADVLAGYKKNLPSLKDNSLLVFDVCGQYCFPKNRIVLFVRAVALSQNLLHAAPAVGTALLLCTIVCR